ncbi:MAG: hypothetical protein SNI32_07335 [Rikenellaceae bacterium]
MKTVKQILKTDKEVASFIMAEQITDAILSGELAKREDIKKALDELTQRSKAEVLSLFYNLTEQEINKL